MILQVWPVKDTVCLWHIAFIRHLSWHIFMKNDLKKPYAIHSPLIQNLPNWESLRYNYKQGVIIKQVHFHKNLPEVPNSPLSHWIFLQRFEEWHENITDALCREYKDWGNASLSGGTGDIHTARANLRCRKQHIFLYVQTKQKKKITQQRNWASGNMSVVCVPLVWLNTSS